MHPARAGSSVCKLPELLTRFASLPRAIYFLPNRAKLFDVDYQVRITGARTLTNAQVSSRQALLTVRFEYISNLTQQ